MPSFMNLSDNSGHNYTDISSDFGNLRIATIRRAARISDSINNVTLSPNSVEKNKSLDENIENKQNSCNHNTFTNNKESLLNDQIPLSRGGITFSIKKLLLENEILRREEVRQAVDKRKQHMEKCEKKLQAEAALMREILASNREKVAAIELARWEAEEKKLAQENELKERHEQQLHAQRLQERKERWEREAEEHRILKEREEVIMKIRNNFRERCRDVGMLSKSCKDKSAVSQLLGSYTAKLKDLSQQMEIINEKARRGELSSIDVNFAEQITRQSEEVLNNYALEVARIDMMYEEEVARREREMNLAGAIAQIERANMQQALMQSHSLDKQSQQTVQTEVIDVQPVGKFPESLPNEIASNATETGATTTDSSSVETVIEEYDQESHQIYQRSKELLQRYTESPDYITFLKAVEMKEFRFKCQKAINLPVNTIASGNGSHLMEKYKELYNLLNGRSSLNINQHQQGPVFCKYLLARNIVSQGETLVSSKPEMAFGIAAVTLALMSDFPDFAEILKARFFTTCPYLVPYFPSKLQEQSEKDYYQKLGYKYVDGAVEKQTKFLNRMSGIMRLYATIIQSNLRKGVNSPHPLGLQNAWRWLAATLNYEVHSEFADICATLILDMLEVLGNSFWTAYPKQCPKLLALIREHYYPQVKNCGTVGGGPATRLEQFLNDSLARNFIPPPNGQLPLNFW